MFELKCQVCGVAIEQRSRKPGPWPDYCSGRCRARAARRRKAGAPIDTPPQTNGGLQAAAHRVVRAIHVPGEVVAVVGLLAGWSLLGWSNAIPWVFYLWHPFGYTYLAR